MVRPVLVRPCGEPHDRGSSVLAGGKLAGEELGGTVAEGPISVTVFSNGDDNIAAGNTELLSDALDDELVELFFCLSGAYFGDEPNEDDLLGAGDSKAGIKRDKLIGFVLCEYLVAVRGWDVEAFNDGVVDGVKEDTKLRLVVLFADSVDHDQGHGRAYLSLTCAARDLMVSEAGPAVALRQPVPAQRWRRSASPA